LAPPISIEDDGDIGLVGVDLKLSNRPLEFDVGGVDQDIDIVESGITKHLPDRDRVPRRVGQFGHVRVVRVANDERDPLLILSASAVERENHRQDGDTERDRYGKKLAHIIFRSAAPRIRARASQTSPTSSGCKNGAACKKTYNFRDLGSMSQ
jgi:hypothetical protein